MLHNHESMIKAELVTESKDLARREVETQRAAESEVTRLRMIHDLRRWTGGRCIVLAC